MSNVTPIAKRAPATRSRVTNGKTLFSGGGDERSVWARRFRDLVAGFESDLGGPGAISAAKAAIIRSAATLQVQLEQMTSAASRGDAFDIDVFGRASGNCRRLLESVGLERLSQVITINPLADHFATPFRREGDA